jgi:hypothetical protein
VAKVDGHIDRGGVNMVEATKSIATETQDTDHVRLTKMSVMDVMSDSPISKRRDEGYPFILSSLSRWPIRLVIAFNIPNDK